MKVISQKSEYWIAVLFPTLGAVPDTFSYCKRPHLVETSWTWKKRWKHRQLWRGYIHNVKPLVNDTAFAFDVQGTDRTTRVVCFTPPKRKQVEDLIKSPVKIARLKTPTKGNDYIFGETSELRSAELQFEPIDYDNIDFKNIHLHAVNSTLDTKVTVLSKGKPKTITEKSLTIYSVSDGSDVLKLNDWCNSNLTVNKVYALVNIRLKKDHFNNFELLTPAKGFRAN